MDDATKQSISSKIQGFDFILHDLCLNKDWSEVRSCLKIFDTTAKVPRSGDLPLHLALSMGCPVDVAEALMKAFPDAATIPSSHNQFPLLLAMGVENACAIYR